MQSSRIDTHPLPWRQRLVRLGRARSQFLLTLFSVTASVMLTSVFFWYFEGKPADIAAYFVPATLIPLAIAPLASGWAIDAAIALDKALAHAAEQASQLAAILSTAPVGIAQVSADHHLQRANALASALLRPDAAGRIDWAALFINTEERQALTAAIEKGIPLQNVRWGWHDSAGGTRLVRGHLAPITEPRTADAGSVVIFEDVTELAALESQLSRTQHLDLAGRLAGGMAHDFNNLLTIILASASTLSRGTPEDQLGLEAIEEAAARGARLTRRLLSISRRDVHAPVVESLGPLLRETVELMARAMKPGIRFEMDAAIPAATAAVDRDALQQALVNLVINAQDAIGEAGGVISLKADERTESNGSRWIIITVRDTGPGMSPAVLSRATEPFFSTKPAHIGTGLGLAIVSDTLTRHGGRLELASAEGQGTEASLWLPLLESEPRSAPSASATRNAPAKGPSLELLLLEDELDLRDTTERVLRRLGHRVTGVGSVAEAQAWLDAGGAPDFILSDVMMPEQTGIDFLRQIRAAGRETPVLLVSGYSAESVEPELAKHKHVAFLAKPWTVSELSEQISALRERSKR